MATLLARPSLPVTKLLTEWELWAVANRMISDHGEDAKIQAAMKADACLDRGDPDGTTNWIAIIRRIDQLQASPNRTLN